MLSSFALRTHGGTAPFVERKLDPHRCVIAGIGESADLTIDSCGG